MQDLEITDYHSSLQKIECTGDEMVITSKDGVDYRVQMSSIATYMAAQWNADQLNALVGMYEPRPDIALTALETGKVINASGVKVAKSGWAVAEFTAQLGNVYLFNPGATSSDVCVFAEKIDKVETRGIDYAYTYDSKGNPLTAKATYNGVTHSYTYTNTYTTQEGGQESLSVVITDDQTGKTVEYLPQTYQTTVGAYQPMVRLNENAELPKDGYCRFVSNFQTSDSIRIAVSYKVDSANLTMKVVRSGMVASMCTQLSKITNKVDEVGKRLNEFISESYADILFNKDFSYISIDGVEHSFKAWEVTRIYPKRSIWIREGIQDIPIEWIDMSHLDISNFVSLKLGGFDAKCTLHKVIMPKMSSKFNIRTSQAFSNCTELEEVDMTNFSAGAIYSDLSRLFTNCKNIREIDLSGLKDYKETSAIDTFFGCNSLERLYIPKNLFGSKITLLWRIFYGCTSLKELDLSGLDLRNICKFETLFYDCSSLRKLNLEGENIDLSSLESNNVNNNFYRCISMEELLLSKKFFSSKLENLIWDFSYMGKWVGESVQHSLVENLFDRKAAGLATLTLKLHQNTKDILSDSDKSIITNRGYIIA